MVAITNDDVKRLADLSALTLSDKETEALRIDIANIIGYIEQLKELETAGVEPSYQVTGLSNVWRDDEISEDSVHYTELVKLAPASELGQVKVPKVL